VRVAQISYNEVYRECSVRQTREVQDAGLFEEIRVGDDHHNVLPEDEVEDRA
jgi:hypothetical protein